MSGNSKKSNHNIIVGSLLSPTDRKLAAKAVADGKVIGVFNRGVNALWINSQNKGALLKLNSIKGEKQKNKPVALTLGFEKILQVIDWSNLSEPLNAFLHSRNLKKELGSLCFIRVPLNKDFLNQFPASTVSKDQFGTIWIQNWDAHGHTPTEKLINLIQDYRVKYPGITSMNISGEPEIVDQKTAEEFCIKNNVSVYLKDSTTHPKLQGSYTIISFDKKGVKLARHGNIPSWIIEKILGDSLIIDKDTKNSNYPPLEFPQKLFKKDFSPEKIRNAVLKYLQDKESYTIINQSLKNTSYV